MTLNRLVLFFGAFFLGALSGWAQVQYVTIKPLVDEVHDTDVSIRKVELTPTYTILYMTFAHKTPGRTPKQPYQVPFPFDQPGMNSSSIQFEPGARLYANRGDASYKFIRAENIPTRERLDVTSGRRIDFVAYFERLAPGVTVFDLFECNDRDGNVCFNFYGVHVTNPMKKPFPSKTSSPPAVKPVPETAKPTPTKPNAMPAAPTLTTVAIQGTVRDAKTRKSIGAELVYQRISGRTANAPETIRADAQTGDYRAVVKPSAVYVVTTTAKGYFAKTDTLATGRADLLHDLVLTPIEKGAKLTLQDIEFDVGKYELRPQSYPELNQLAQLMHDNPTLKIRLEGHTDVLGDFDTNLELSRNRVKEVKAYLVKKGIDAGRIDTIGYGASRPLIKKSADQNRRVELVITES